jgi:hypothetical protein
VTWTPDRCALLKQCVQEEMTATQAGRVLGVSRAAALGKARRMRLRFRVHHMTRRAMRPGEKGFYSVVKVDPDTHEAIRRRAEKEKRSYTAVVRDLIEWGLLA